MISQHRMICTKSYFLFQLNSFLIFWSYIQPVHGTSGPYVCADRSVETFGTYLTEFPPGADDVINFLEYGDICNNKAQSGFETKLLRSYQKALADNSKRNEQMFAELDIIWNEYRGHLIDGALGNRICNPRRLLGCHITLKICVCRPDFKLDGEYGRPSYSAISVHSELVESLDLVKDTTHLVTKCRAIARSNCLWEPVWLNYCHVECIRGYACIGIDTKFLPGGLSTLKCVPCKSDTAEGIKKCEEEGIKESELLGRNLNMLKDDYDDLAVCRRPNEILSLGSLVLVFVIHYRCVKPE